MRLLDKRTPFPLFAPLEAEARMTLWNIVCRVRYISFAAVASSVLGSALLFVIGTDKTIRAVMYYGRFKEVDPKLAHLSPSDIATVYLIRSLDAFLIALALLIFAYGVYSLFIARGDVPAAAERIAGLPQIRSVSFLKHTLGEVIIVILFVTTLEEILTHLNHTLSWEMLVLPVTILLLALSLKFLQMRDHWVRQRATHRVGPRSPIMDQPIDTPDKAWTELRPFPEQPDAGRGKVRIWSLVLEARGVPHRRRLVGARVTLYTAPEELAWAEAEIRAYEAENRLWPPRRAPQPAAPGNTGRTFAVLVALGLFHDLTFQPPGRVLGIAVDWREIGAMHAGKVLRGEWWRAVTALTLHADGLHLAGNLLLGGILLAQLGRQMGVGLASLLVLGAGTLGNLTNAAVREAGHRSIGASTAVFGALGVLVARSAWDTPRRDWRRWVTPLGAGAGLIAFTGVGGERTDYLAHLLGFAWGLAVGALTQWPWPVARLRGWKAAAAGAGALAIVAGAWALAL